MKNNYSKVTAPAVLLVFALFALCMLGVLLLGAESYQQLVTRGENSFQQRTAAQYLTTRIRQADQTGGVELGSFGGQDALVLPETIQGVDYVTRIYCCDGWLRELFTAASGDFKPEDGEKLLQLQALTLSANGRCLTMELTMPEGSQQSLTLFLRSGEVLP